MLPPLYLKIKSYSDSGFLFASVHYIQDRLLSCLHIQTKNTQHGITLVEKAEDRI